MNSLLIALVVVYTAILGTLAVLVGILLPGGAAFIPLARLWAWFILRTCGVRFTVVYHPDFDPSRPGLYMANHRSQFDIPVLILAMPSAFRFIAKRELLYIPIFGWALWLAGFVFIDRRDRRKAIRSLQRAVRQMRSGSSIIVFPEGTRSPGDYLLPFKKGGFILALEAGVPIVPVSIRGGHAVLPKGSLRIRPGTMDVIFGRPIDTTLYSSESKEALMETVRGQIERGLQVADPSQVGQETVGG